LSGGTSPRYAVTSGLTTVIYKPKRARDQRAFQPTISFSEKN
jgi:hypothetical protein